MLLRRHQTAGDTLELIRSSGTPQVVEGSRLEILDE
jgi:hypothetical protein